MSYKNFNFNKGLLLKLNNILHRAYYYTEPYIHLQPQAQLMEEYS